jgi:uncharacterized DUF497 family protein
MPMRVEFDQAKRDVTLAERGLDFADAVSVFEGRSITFEDERRAYGESWFITIGELGERMVVIVWTPRGDARRIISMRRANDREQALYALG